MAKAIVRSVARAPVFRAQSFLWPRTVAEDDGSGRSWKLYPVCTRRRHREKPFSFMAAFSRYSRAALSI